MPNELFYPVGIVPCIMVFKAHIPHNSSNQKTWFGYWKEDGFIKTKHKGRIDEYSKWETIRDHWVNTYRNRENIPGECVKQTVTEKDEWCAEAYMETNYDVIAKSDFENVVKDIFHF